MRQPVIDAVARTIVSRRDANRDPEGRGGLERLIELLDGLRGPGRFRPAPAYRDDRRLVHGIVHGLGDRVQEPLRRIGREVHHDLRCGRNSAGDFDVEHHLAVGPVGASGRSVARLVNRHARDHRRWSHAQRGEVGIQV